MSDDVFEPAGMRLPNVARIYDYLLGGQQNFAVDRVAARALSAVIPGVAEGARANRAFLGRAVDYLARDVGISQFLDIGSGLPAGGQVHDIAHAINPDARVVYTDNDPTVVAHARCILDRRSSKVAIAEGDVRFPAQLLAASTTGMIDLSQPVAVLMVAVLHFVPDDEHPWSRVRGLVRRLAPGSYLVLSHVTGENLDDESVKKAAAIYNSALTRGAVRGRGEILRFFDGTELIDPPGLADVATWSPLKPALPSRRPALFLAGVARKLDGGEAS